MLIFSLFTPQNEMETNGCIIELTRYTIWSKRRTPPKSHEREGTKINDIYLATLVDNILTTNF